MNFTSQIDNWYTKNKRDLPWRKNKDPYSVWLSEIILQQTQIQQGLPYYTKFIKKSPDVLSGASAHEEEILKLWHLWEIYFLMKIARKLYIRIYLGSVGLEVKFNKESFEKGPKPLQTFLKQF